MIKEHLEVTQDPDFPHACMVVATCRCGVEMKCNAHWTDYNRWTHGELIQTVWSLMSPERREFLISGVCPKCWAELFTEKT